MARGSILSRKNRDGTTTFSIKYRVSGRQVKKAIGPSRREAERALTAALAKVDRGEIRSTSQETFKQAAERWLARKQPVIEASTYRDYETHLRLRLLPAFGRRKLRQITRGHVEDYLARLDADGGLSRKTINDSLIPLRQILGRAVREGVIATNPPPTPTATRRSSCPTSARRCTTSPASRPTATSTPARTGTGRSPRC